MHKKGFSYAEAMVTMLIVAIIMVATTPILSQRKNVNRGTIWSWTRPSEGSQQGVSTFFGLSPLQRVYIGSQGANDENEKARLIVTAPQKQNPNGNGAVMPIYERFYNDNGLITNELRANATAANEGQGSLGFGANALSNLLDETVDNTAMGYNALKDLLNGSQNTAFGSGALEKTTGSNNTAIGFAACQKAKGNGNICIGNAAGPDTEIEVSDSLYIDTSVGNTPLIAANFSNATNPYTGITQRTVVINGTLLLPDANIAGQLINVNAAISGASDARLKNIKGVSNIGLNEINKIVVKNFTYKNDKENKPHVGVIAQELMKIFPNSVTKGENGYYSVNKEEMFFGMLNAIKELDKKFKKEDEKVTKLEKEIETLRMENAQLASRIAEIEKAMKK